MFLSPLNLVCVRYYGRIEQGAVTKPLKVQGIDRQNSGRYDIVLKVRHPDTSEGHHEGTSLACELICAMIGRAIGLPVPDYAIIQIPEGLYLAGNDENIRRLLQRNVGLNFGTIYQEGFHSWNPRKSDKIPTQILSNIEGTLAFDATVINGDRKTEKPNLLWNGRKVFLIDHSLALPVHRWSDDGLDSSPLFPEAQVRQHCTYEALNGLQFRFDTILEKWQEIIKDDDLDNLRAIIPASWEARKGDLDKIFRFLKARPKRFIEIQADLTRILV